MKKKTGKGFLKLAERITRIEVEKNEVAKLPVCGGILHQPKRPKMNTPR